MDKHEIFSKILVLPYKGLLSEGPIQGGPLWPEFASRSWERHWRFRRIADNDPSDEFGSLFKTDELSGTWIYGGAMVSHFGHQIAEFMHRIPIGWSGKVDGVLFSSLTSGRKVLVPSFVKDCIKFMVGRELPIRLIERPTIVDNLLVFPQGSHWGGDAEPEYLAELSDLQRSRSRSFSGHPSFVTRRGMRTAKIAGESYLCEFLQSQGVQIVNPELISWNEQQDIYASSPLLVFSEGSAIHGVEHLGRLSSTLMLARRRGRPSDRLMRVLEQRSTDAIRCDSIRSFVGKKYDLTTDSFIETPNGLTLVGIEEMRASFAVFGISKLFDNFSKIDFKSSVESDVSSFLQSNYVKQGIDIVQLDLLTNQINREVKKYFHDIQITA